MQRPPEAGEKGNEGGSESEKAPNGSIESPQVPSGGSSGVTEASQVQLVGFLISYIPRYAANPGRSGTILRLSFRPSAIREPVGLVGGNVVFDSWPSTTAEWGGG